MERDSQVTFTLFDKSLQTRHHAHTGNRDALRRPSTGIISRKDSQRTQYFIYIIHRFSFTHIDNIGKRKKSFIADGWITRKVEIENLIKYICGGKVGLKTECTRHAKTTTHLTPRLGGDT